MKKMKADEDGTVKVLNTHRILVAVTGGIAAYKVVSVVRGLVKRGVDVRVMMTRSATRFVHPTTFSAITGNPVSLDMFREDGIPNTDHLELPHNSDLILVAPATANILAKMAHGIADDLVSTALLAAEVPVLLAPAMNSSMWVNPATQANIKLLTARGFHWIGPVSGDLAAPGELPGVGRMSEPEAILAELDRIGKTSQRFSGKKILITAGRTEEPIDEVRVLTNRSSGRMGVALAESARREGAEVLLVHGPLEVPLPAGIATIEISTASEMLAACTEHLNKMDIAIFAAAVADWRPRLASPGTKMKKEAVPKTLDLVENPDIAAETRTIGNAYRVGFALEESENIETARQKLKRKGFDAILLNTLQAMGSVTNTLIWITKEREALHSGEKSKQELGQWILDRIYRAHLDKATNESNDLPLEG